MLMDILGLESFLKLCEIYINYVVNNCKLVFTLYIYLLPDTYAYGHFRKFRQIVETVFFVAINYVVNNCKFVCVLLVFIFLY